MFHIEENWDFFPDSDLHESLFKKERDQTSEIPPKRNSKKKKIKGAPPDTSKDLSKLTKKRLQKSPCVQRAAKKLAGAQFRFINEKLYTSTGQEALKLFEKDSNLFSIYHEGFKEQSSRWPLNPLDCLIEYILKLPQDYVIADFGCGEGRLSLTVPHKVHSFDFISVGDHVTSCDMSRVPLADASVDVGVFCLSLMGVNLIEYLVEARRVLKCGGILKIYEIQSRIACIDEFVCHIESLGFKCKEKKALNKMFIDLEFVLVDKNKKSKLNGIVLKPCLYKKR